jgi:drug/metabolite transporter (DMT)-like permease
MRTHALSPQLVGILAMSAAGAVFSGHDAITKSLAARYPIGEIIFFRQLASALILTTYIWFAQGLAVIEPVRVNGQILRALFFVASTVLIAISVANLPLPTALAIIFSSPLLVAALSAPLLKEAVGPRRGLAIIVGFIGVLVIIRPGGTSFTWLLLIPIAAASASALRDITTRILHRTDSTYAILFWSNIAVLTAMLFSAPFGWKSVAIADAGLLILGGALNTLAHFLTITALRHGDAALVTPFRYTALVWATLLGFLIWRNVPDFWTIVGALIIVAAGVYLVLREAQLRRAAKA